MAEKQRKTTAPLTDEEIAETLQEIPADEFLERFDEIFTRDMDLPERLEELIGLDDYMENELREMFQSIIAQYLTPIEFAVERIRGGDNSKRTAEEGLEALMPILSASESLEYKDITENLKELERPLRGLAEGTRRRLTKRDLAELGDAWVRLDARLRPDRPREAPQAPSPISLGALPKYLTGVSAAHIRSLRAAGLTTLQDVASAPVGDVVDVTGLPETVAARIQSFAIGAVAVEASGGRRRTEPVPPGWMRVHIDSDIFKGRVTFEYGSLGRYVEPILERLAKPEEPPAPPAKPAAKPARARRTTTKKTDKKRSS